MITLYTLPNCGICNMVKTKLKQKNIQFEEQPFENIANIINSDHAPALKVDENHIYNTPSTIVSWIMNSEG